MRFIRSKYYIYYDDLPVLYVLVYDSEPSMCQLQGRPRSVKFRFNLEQIGSWTILVLYR